jgi:fumarate hydratase class II
MNMADSGVPPGKTRIERDSLGEIEVPADALYGAQTRRAIDNFPIGGGPLPRRFIATLIAVKQAAARANLVLGELDATRAKAIDAAAAELLAGDFMPHFPIDRFQTGSATSTNMNANEVLARMAASASGETVDGNDHVNRGQSSNDVIPSTIHASAAVALAADLQPALAHLAQTLRDKAAAVGAHVKTGRTHLMDALPVTFGQVLGGWAAQVEAAAAHLAAVDPALRRLAQGGTAVGTGVNAHPDFADRFCRELSSITGLAFSPAPDRFAAMGSQDTSVALSGALKVTAVALMKIANDLRWMNSGPIAGLGEIRLPALQPGSSIMPGKVNPVVPEAMAMVCAQVIGHDAAITVAGQSGNFELNVMLPLVASNLLEMIEWLANGARLLADRAIAGFEVDEARLAESLARNPILVTTLNPRIGYARAAAIAKEAYATGRPILDVALERTDLDRAELERLLDPRAMTGG